MNATQAPTRSWLIGPAADLLLGCGVLYTGVFAALAVAGPQVRGLTSGAIIILLTLLLSAPHYGATLLRVFENRADRSKYHFFAVHVTLGTVVAFVIGQHSIQVASWLLTIYIIWSPWHYTGQNYGLAVMFLRRAGVPLPPGVKRLLHASFILSYALLFFVLYTGSEGGADLARSYGAAGNEKIRVESLGIPDFVRDVGTPAVGAAYLIATVATIVALLRRARARDLLPVGLLLLTQALWFSLPTVARFSGFGAGIDP